jgi:hypothetical protein
MSLTDILIILGCLAGGYWIVSSVMGPGIDITRRTPPPEAGKEEPRAYPLSAPKPGRRPVALPRATNPHLNDWHVILDVPRSASRGDIEAAFRHQQKKAQAAGDALLQQRVQQAREAGLAALK